MSSTGHLTIVSRMLGYDIADPGITAFTAVIQVGAIIAVIIYFWSDIRKLVRRLGARPVPPGAARRTRSTGWPGW